MEWITSSNPTRECWRRLFEFANTEIATDAIVRVHGAAGPQAKNYAKQANQMRVAIMQAKEYFDAAAGSSPFTAANHLYYGAMSLATAVMLLRGDGNYSLDRLRLHNGNRHHGLDFRTSAKAVTCAHGLSILSDSNVRLRANGHFANFYDRLPEAEPVSAVLRTLKGTSIVSNLGQIATRERVPMSRLRIDRSPLMKLIEQLPDFAVDLRRFGVSVTASTISIEHLVNTDTLQISMRFRVHGAPDVSALHDILNRFTLPAAYWNNVDCREHGGGAIVEVGPLPQLPEFRIPATRLTAEGDTIVYGGDVELPEFADAYLVAFGLSMLSRYFPDLWITTLESHCKAAKVIERFVEVYLRKFPVLAMTYLTGVPFVFTHRAPPHEMQSGHGR